MRKLRVGLVLRRIRGSNLALNVYLFVQGAVFHLCLLRMVVRGDYLSASGRASFNRPETYMAFAFLGGAALLLLMLPLARIRASRKRAWAPPALLAGAGLGVLATAMTMQAMIFLIVVSLIARLPAVLPPSRPWYWPFAAFPSLLIPVEAYGLYGMALWVRWGALDGMLAAVAMLFSSRSNPR